MLGTEHNFVKYTTEDIDTLETSYDYGSLMHYESTAFTSNGLPTIVPRKSANITLGQRNGLSPIDILEIKRYYKCFSVANRNFAMLMNATFVIETIFILLVHYSYQLMN